MVLILSNTVTDYRARSQENTVTVAVRRGKNNIDPAEAGLVTLPAVP
jgi:hypothetical protein